jgi:hypothetical protein
MDDIATMSELRDEDALMDYHDNIREELMQYEDNKIIELVEGPVYYGNLEELEHGELVYMYQRLSIAYRELMQNE